MDYVINRFSLDLSDEKSQVRINVRKFESNRKLIINLTNCGSPYALTETGLNIIAYFRYSDEETYTASGAVVNGAIEVTLNPTLTANVGEFLTFIRIASTSPVRKIMTPFFVINVTDTYRESDT